MSDSKAEDGVIVALVERFRNLRLPRALNIKARVDRGEVLQDAEIDFLNRVLQDATEIQSMVKRRPEFEQVAAQAVHLYHEITEKALQNQRAADSE